uniref:Agamous-like MADS-box protein AGL9 like n=1 Tax=Talaromyces marneffei PM1 TaxID=1077442 RepID=A0A093VSS4_TALMA
MDPKIERRKALQRRNRRMKSLLLKAVDMSILCDAEIANYYPIPTNMTLEDFQRGQGPNKDQNPESLNDEAGEED